ncbi:MAG: hypothetical protein RRC07_03585 [Anaerolineae bacterium]|nr:hypothetical protein [Anaerolineae bacterium]
MKEELEQAFAAIKNGEEEQARVLLAQMLKDDPDYVPGWVLLSKLAPNRIQKAAFLDKILALDPDHVYARQEMEALEAGVSTMPETEPASESESEIVAAEVAEVDALAGAAEAAPVEAPPDAAEVTPAAGLPSADEADTAPEFVAEEGQVDLVEEPEEPAKAITAEEEARTPISADPLDYEAQASGDTLPPWLAEDEALLIDELAGEETGDEGHMPAEPDLPEWLKEEPATEWPDEDKPAGGAVRLREETAAPARERPVAPRERLPAAPATGAPSWLLPALAVALVIVFILLIYFGARLLG